MCRSVFYPQTYRIRQRRHPRSLLQYLNSYCWRSVTTTTALCRYISPPTTTTATTTPRKVDCSSSDDYRRTLIDLTSRCPVGTATVRGEFNSELAVLSKLHFEDADIATDTVADPDSPIGLATLPSTSLPSPSLSLPFLSLPLPSLPLDVGPLYRAKGSGGAL